MNWVYEHSRASGNDFVVLLTIADHCDENDECFPGRERLATRSRVSKATAIRSTKRLESLGELEIVKGGGGRVSNRYRLVRKDYEGLQFATSTDHGQGLQSDTPGVASCDTPGVAPVTPQGLQAVTPEPSLDHHPPVIEPAIEFETFWRAYPKKRGKQRAMGLWGRLGADGRAAAVEGIAAYVASVDDPTFLKHGDTYLSHRPWLDTPDVVCDVGSGPVAVVVKPPCSICCGSTWVDKINGDGVVRCECVADTVDA